MQFRGDLKGRIGRTRERLGLLPRVSLAHLPTPLDPCPRLSDELGVDLFVKREDCTGLALGGNKVRQHEYVLGQALTDGADCLVQGAATQSNHSRQLAAAGAKLGIDVYLIPQVVDSPGPPSGNFLLDHLLGATITPITAGASSISAKARLVEQLRLEGRRPYVTGMGAQGSLVTAAVAYVEAVIEIVEDLDRAPDWIVTASQGSTQAGLLLACELLGLPTRVLGVAPMPATQEAALSVAEILELAHGAAGLLDRESGLTEADVLRDDDFVGAGYGLLTDESRAAITTLASTEGILLDPVYSGKAFAALLQRVRSGSIAPGARVVFVHTGGVPALFAADHQLVTS